MKKQYVDKLREMNSKVELRQPFGGVSKDFQKNYAFVVLELDKINHEMNSIFENIEQYIHKEAPHMAALDQSLNARNRCDEQAAELIEQSHRVVNDDRMRALTLQFTSLMLQINHVAEGESCSSKLSLLDQAVHEIKDSLHPNNRKLFEDKVETSIAFLKNGLQEGQSMLAAFTNNRHKSKEYSNMLPDRQHENLSSAEEYEEGEEGEDELDEDEEEEVEIKDEEVFVL